MCHAGFVTISIRRVLLAALFISALIGMSGAGMAWFGMSSNSYGSSFTPSTTMVWWGITRDYDENDILGALCVISFYILLALVGETSLRRGFGPNPASEMFFLRLFLLLLPLQAARLVVPFSAYFGIAATRIAWFGRFAGITALLNLGLYSSNMPIHRSGYILGMGALAALAIAVMIPLDITQPMGNLLYRSGIDIPLALSCVSLEVLAVLSLAGTGVSRMNRRYYMLALFLLLIIVGSDLSFLGDLSLAIPGAALMVAGIIGFSWQTRKIYQWL